MFYNAKGSKTNLKIGKRKDLKLALSKTKTLHQTAPLSNVEAII
jgi:hypothetical protein